MGVKEVKINKLLALFAKNEVVTVEEIKDNLNINDRSVKSYIGYLREYGIEVVPMNKKYGVVAKETLSGGLLNNQEFRMMKIMLTIGENSGKLNRKNLVDEICTSLCDEESISRKTIERALKSCEEKGYIYLDENNNYRAALETETFYVTNEEEIFKFIELCELYKEHLPFFNEVDKLKSKLARLSAYEDVESHVFCMGRKYGCADILRNTIKQFEGFDYRKKALNISYTSKIGDISVTIEIVTLLYNWENDKSYVIGMVGEKLYFSRTSFHSCYPRTDDNFYSFFFQLIKQ